MVDRIILIFFGGSGGRYEGIIMEGLNDLLIYTLSHALGSPSSHRYFSTTCCLPRMAAFRNSSVSTGPNCYTHAETRKHVHTRTNTHIPQEYSSKGNRKGVLLITLSRPPS